MKYKYGDSVRVKSGFYKGQTGKIIDRTIFGRYSILPDEKLCRVGEFGVEDKPAMHIKGDMIEKKRINTAKSKYKPER